MNKNWKFGSPARYFEEQKNRGNKYGNIIGTPGVLEHLNPTSRKYTGVPAKRNIGGFMAGSFYQSSHSGQRNYDLGQNSSTGGN